MPDASSCHLIILDFSFHVDDSIHCQHTSSPLGNGAVVETSEKRLVILRRSNNVGEFPGHFVFPGGHPEVLIYNLAASSLYWSMSSVNLFIVPSFVNISLFLYCINYLKFWKNKCADRSNLVL